MSNMNNIAGISVATSASNNNYRILASGINGISAIMSNIEIQQGLKNYSISYGEFLKKVCGADARFFEISLDETHQYRIDVDKDYYSREYVVKAWVIGGEYEIIYEKKLGFKVMRGLNINATMAAMEFAVLACVADYEKRVADEEQQQDWADFLDMCDRKAEIVSAYQTEIDGYVNDIIAIADKMENIENKVDAFAIKQIVKKIEQTETDCYDAIMDAECDCFGTEIDLAALWLWYNNYGQHYTDNNFSREDLDLDDLIDALDYMITESDKALGIDKETLDFELGGYEDETSFLGLVADYPSYIWDELRDFISTYYHYAYCA